MAFDSAHHNLASVYGQTWHDFYKWELKSARALLKRLDADVDSQSSDSFDSDGCDEPSSQTELPLRPQSELAHIQTFHGGFNNVIRLPAALVRCPTIRPSPCYEGCDVLTSPVFLGHKDRPIWPRAVPLADDPSFCADEYFQELAGANLDGLSDQERVEYSQQLKASQAVVPEDPNLHAIELESLRRFVEAGFVMTDLRDHCVLSQDPAALIHHCWKRDLPPWPTFTDFAGQFLDIAKTALSETKPVGLRQHFMAFIGESCFRLSCLEPSCVSHPPDQTLLLRDRPIPPLYAPDSSTGTHCGDDCYKLSHCLEEDNEAAWGEDELGSLALIVSQCPAVTTCGIAVAMDRPCNEIFSLRCALPKRIPEMFAPRPPRKEVAREDVLNLPTSGQHSHLPFGCSHTGPCTSQEDCVCSKSGHFCQTACSCTQQCGRQYPGCECRTSSDSAACRSPQNCLCMRLQRECEPGVCRGCLTHEGREKCLNRVLGGHPLTRYKVAESEHGYGLFAREKILAKQIIGEYIGEVISSPRTYSQAVISRHSGRNYLFDLLEEEDLFLDSLEAGNAMRFINHSDGRKANAKTLHTWVNGDVKLAVYAVRNIRKNQEILMNYGTNYFL